MSNVVVRRHDFFFCDLVKGRLSSSELLLLYRHPTKVENLRRRKVYNLRLLRYTTTVFFGHLELLLLVGPFSLRVSQNVAGLPPGLFVLTILALAQGVYF